MGDLGTAAMGRLSPLGTAHALLNEEEPCRTVPTVRRAALINHTHVSRLTRLSGQRLGNRFEGAGRGAGLAAVDQFLLFPAERNG